MNARNAVSDGTESVVQCLSRDEHRLLVSEAKEDFELEGFADFEGLGNLTRP